MDLVQQRYQQIEDIFQSMNIYKTILLYDDLNDFDCLKSMMLRGDYTFKSSSDNARIYDILFSDFENYMDDIDISTVSLIICMGNKSIDAVKKTFCHNTSNLILMISI